VSTTNVALAKQISPHVNLEAVVVRQVNLLADFDPVDLPEALTLESKYRSTYEIRTDAEGTRRIAVTIEFRFESQAVTEDSAQNSSIKIDATFLLLYLFSTEQDFEPRCYEYFAQVNGALNAWPYWREFVQSATSRAGLPGVIVPLFRVVTETVDDMTDCSHSADPTLLGTTQGKP
jgi:preprotein translocase subunit SecB